MSLDHTITAPIPRTHLVAVEVPSDTSKALVKSALKSGRLYADELLHFLSLGLECSRLHKEKTLNPRKRK